MKSGMLEWGFAAAPMPGESASGDLYVVRAHAGGVLVAVIDAVGHGVEAARTAARAAAVLEQDPADAVAALLRRCHEGLRGTRGAAMALASLDEPAGVLNWLAVGNVCGVVMRGDSGRSPRLTTLLVRGGMVGSHLPELSPARIALGRGDTFVLATDGIDRRFTDSLPAALAPQPLAERILREHCRRSDDALVLVASRAGAG
jgi:serine phosphatase RsbU (regulator of sigma subunit)